VSDLNSDPELLSKPDRIRKNLSSNPQSKQVLSLDFFIKFRQSYFKFLLLPKPAAKDFHLPAGGESGQRPGEEPGPGLCHLRPEQEARQALGPASLSLPTLPFSLLPGIFFSSSFIWVFHSVSFLLLPFISVQEFLVYFLIVSFPPSVLVFSAGFRMVFPMEFPLLFSISSPQYLQLGLQWCFQLFF
jgi:hypothetical protein